MKYLNKLKAWIIKVLGGITIENHNKFKDGCGEWAIEHLINKDKFVTPDCSIYAPFNGDNICIIRSGIMVCNIEVCSIIVAPWCRNVYIESVSRKPVYKELN